MTSSRKAWMVAMPTGTTPKARAGKPIAPAAIKPKAAAKAASPSPPVDAREQAERDRRYRTQGAGHARASLNPDRQRERMVERLQASGIRHPAVLAAMGRTPRHRFVDEGLATTRTRTPRCRSATRRRSRSRTSSRG